MNHELAKTLTTALVQFIDRARPEGTMCCSNTECANLENSFNAENFIYIEAFVKRRLPNLTEFEDKLVSFALQCGGQWDTANEEAKKWSNEFLALAKKELLSYADESNPAIEAMADLERTFECNPDKLPIWLKDELTKRHLEGYIKGREETMREMKDFLESHFDTKKAREGEDLTDLYRKEYAQPLCLRNGGVCTNPMRDCINCIPTLERFNTYSGTSTATLQGNTSATDGKAHNPSFTD